MPERGPVLLVEDEAMIAFDAEEILADLGFGEVIVCNTYESAEAALDGRDFGLAVFDLNLKGRLSTPLIRRAVEAGTKVVLTTGYQPEIVEIDDPAVRYVIKPYTAQILARAIAASA